MRYAVALFVTLLLVTTVYAGNMKTSQGVGTGKITFKQGALSGDCDDKDCNLRDSSLGSSCVNVGGDGTGNLVCLTDDDIPESGDFDNLSGGDGIDHGVEGTLKIDLYTSSGSTGVAASSSGMEFTDSKMSLLRGCADNQILKWNNSSNDWNCEADDKLATLGQTSCWNESIVSLNNAYYPNATFYCPLANGTAAIGGGCGGTSYIGYGLLYPWDIKVRTVYCNFRDDMECTGTCGAGGDDDEIIIQLRKGVRSAPTETGGSGGFAETDFGPSCTLSATDGFADHEKHCTIDTDLPAETIIQVSLNANNLSDGYLANCSVTVCLNDEITSGGE